MTKYDFDVLYIGAGHGTFDGAIPLAARGVKVGVVEFAEIGGTCPNRGCNPKIALDDPVVVQRQQEALTGHKQAPIDWSAAVAHKHDVIKDLPDMIEGFITSHGIQVLGGRGHLFDEHTVHVNGVAYTAEKIVIATGLRPHRLDVPGTELAHDSEEFMNLPVMPKSLVVVGAGYVGMEFATMANAAGADVTVIMRHDRALRQFPAKYVEFVVADLKARGVKFVTNAEVAEFKRTSEGVTVETDLGSFDAEWVLDATGRVPNVQNMGLEEIGVEFNERGIVVNDHLQTSVPSIYASGDVIDKTQPRLTPTAVFESTYLMHQFAGDTTDAIDYPVIPHTTFTSPRIAAVGVTLDDAVANPDLYDVAEHDISQDWYRQVKNEKGFNAIIKNKDGLLVGAVEVSDRAEDVINTLSPVIELKLDAAQLERIITIFPAIANDSFGQI